MPETRADRRTVHEERTRRFIVDATRELIRAEGLDSLNTRRIAEAASFAVGTLYNHFTDYAAILAYAAADYLDEVHNVVLRDVEGIRSIPSRIRQATRSYAGYFLQNPEAFKLVFMAPIEHIPDALEKRLLVPKVALLIHDWLVQAGDAGLVPKHQCELVEDILGSTVHGMLLLHITGRNPAAPEALLERMDDVVRLMLPG